MSRQNIWLLLNYGSNHQLAKSLVPSTKHR